MKSSRLLILTYSPDITAPSVVLTSAQSGVTASSPFSVTITFSEAVTGFAAGDITVGNGSAGNLATSNNIAFTADITPAAVGTVTVDVAAGVCTDAAGNLNTAAVQFSIDYYTAVFYVSVSGDDTNNGTSTATPWKHHPWDLSATGTADGTTLLANQAVIYKQETHYGVYVSSPGGAAALIITRGHPSWGSGGAILSGAVDPSTLTWEADGGSFKCTLAVQPTYVVFNSTILTFATGKGNTVGTNEFDWSANTLYVNVGANPGTGVLKAANKAYTVLAQKANILFQDLTIELGNGAATAAVSSVNGVEFKNCTIRYCNTPGIYLIGGSGNKVTNCTIYSTKPGVDLANSASAEITGNAVYSCPTAGIRLQGDGNIVRNNTIRNNPLYGISSNGSTNSQIDHNQIYSNGTGQKGHAGAGGAGVYIFGASVGCLIYCNNIYSNYLGVFHSTTAGTGGNKIYYNVVRDSTVNGIDNEADPGVNPVEIYNNTVIHNPHPDNIPPYTGHGISTQLAGKVNKIGNNLIVIKQLGDNCNGVSLTTNDAAFVYAWLDHNLYYNNTGGAAKLGMLNGSYETVLADWQDAVQADAKVFDMEGTESLGEANGVSGDPLFVNAAGNNFHLSAGSPAISAGIAIAGLTTDYDGVAVGSPPSIGAFEFVA